MKNGDSVRTKGLIIERLKGVRKRSVLVSATNMVPLMAGSPANVDTFGWKVLPVLGLVRVNGE